MAQDYNRIMSADDVLKQTIEVRDNRREVPASDILTGTLLCLKFNEDWFPHIIGAVNALQTYAAWIGDDDDSNTGTRQITKLLASDMSDCSGAGDCDILTLLADEEFYETEYVPATFGEYYAETVANETAQAAVYDDTPQSIAPDAPVGAPDDIEKNALCAAIHRFVRLYASTKLCLIQSKNFVEILWTKMANAANNFYDAAVSLMSPIYSPNIFSCFVSDAAAITALQDDAAIEELACYIYDELKAVTMSQANFDAAVLDAATDLTGDAQKIACIMNNDNSLSLYINMLESYNVTLQKAPSELPDCPCETGSYRLWAHNFSDGFGPFTKTYSGNTALGILDGGRLRGGDITTTRRISINWDDFDMAWRIRSVKIYYEHVGGIGHGSNDTHIVSLRPNIGSNTGSSGVISNGFAANGIGTRCWVGSGSSYLTGFRQVTIFMSVSDPSDASNIYLDRVEILFVDGYGPGGALTNDGDLCT